jgi:hypothetical protein
MTAPKRGAFEANDLLGASIAMQLERVCLPSDIRAYGIDCAQAVRYGAPDGWCVPCAKERIAKLESEVAAAREAALEEAAVLMDCPENPKCISCTWRDRAEAIRALKSKPVVG